MLGALAANRRRSGGGGGTAPIDPLTLAPSAWYDPSDLATLFQDTAGTVPVTADGQAVARVNDKSGGGRHLTQATAANRPLYRTDGTLHWLDLDGANDFLASAAGSTIAQPDTQIAAVLFENGAASQGTIFDGGATDQIMGAEGANNYRMYAGSNVSGGARNAAAHVLFGFFSGAASTLKVDGAQIIAANAGTASLVGALYLGCYGGSVQFLNGRFYGGGIVPRALTAAEESGLLAHLNGKAGI